MVLKSRSLKKWEPVLSFPDMRNQGDGADRVHSIKRETLKSGDRP